MKPLICTSLLLAGSLFFFSSLLVAQNIAGTWEGNSSYSFLITKPDKIVVEIQVYNDSIVNGASHFYYKDSTYEHYTITGVYHALDSTIEFEEDSILSLKLGFLDTHCQGRYELKLRKDSNNWLLEGEWRDRSKKFIKCPKQQIRLMRPAMEESLNSGVIVYNPLLQRSTVIQSLIEYKAAESDSVRIEVYDNGEIDHDSISLYLNDEPLLIKKEISSVPITLFLNLDRTLKFNKLRLVAENLGTIPPCTALLIIYTKDHRYQVNLSSNFENNSAIEFFLKE